MIDNPQWSDEALCAEVDPEIFFPDQGERHRSRQAREVCGACNVQAECLAYSLTHGIGYGIWGGIGARARVRMPGYRKGAA